MTKLDSRVWRSCLSTFGIGLVFILGLSVNSPTATAQTPPTPSPQATTTTPAQPATTTAAQSSAPKTLATPGVPTNPVGSAYSIDPKVTGISVPYKTQRNAQTGVIIIVPGASTPKTVKIFWQTPGGDPPSDLFLVSINVTYKNIQGTYAITTPIARTDDHLVVDLSTFIPALVNDISSMLPCCFDARTMPILGESVSVDFTVTPVLPSDPLPNAKIKKGTGTKATGGPLPLTFQQVIGDLPQ